MSTTVDLRFFQWGEYRYRCLHSAALAPGFSFSSGMIISSRMLRNPSMSHAPMRFAHGLSWRRYWRVEDAKEKQQNMGTGRKKVIFNGADTELISSLGGRSNITADVSVCISFSFWRYCIVHADGHARHAAILRPGTSSLPVNSSLRESRWCPRSTSIPAVMLAASSVLASRIGGSSGAKSHLIFVIATRPAVQPTSIADSSLLFVGLLFRNIIVPGASAFSENTFSTSDS